MKHTKNALYLQKKSPVKNVPLIQTYNNSFFFTNIKTKTTKISTDNYNTIS